LAHQLKDLRVYQAWSNTIVTQDRFLAELALVASRGYAWTTRNTKKGCGGIAAPVRDHWGGVVGGDQHAGPTFRVSGSVFLP